MKKNACAYVRVSTNTKTQEHSFEFQNSYWNDALSTNNDFNFVGVYADRGISGKSVNKRTQFMKMMNAARNGQIDIIFCKSVQRFARNTTELLSYVKELRDIGVAVVFEKENINTLKTDSDIYLTVAAALAEDDLSRYSENINWSIKDKYTKGEMHIGWRLYGYYVQHARIYEINKEEAEVVKDIFNQFICGCSTGEICRKLNNNEIKAPLGGKWSSGEIRLILANEKYKGDIVLQKYYHENGTQHKNNGERDSFYVKNSHHAIVSSEVWEMANQRLRKTGRPHTKGKIKPTYPFSGLIVCGICGMPYIHRISNAGFSCATPYWRCSSGHHNQGKCDSTQIKDSVLKEKFIQAYNKFVLSKGINEFIEGLQKKIDSLMNEDNEAMRLYTNGWINNSDYQQIHSPIIEEIKELTKKINENKNREITEKDFNTITIFDEDKVFKFINKICVLRWAVEFHFYNGVVITEEFTNRKRRK